MSTPFVDVSKPLVLTYVSKSKKTSDKDASWSKKEGVNAALLDDYKKYFKAFVGRTAAEYLDFVRNNSNDDVSEEWRQSRRDVNRRDEYLFYIKLAELIEDRKKFSMYGRVFKILEK